jgi:hypothetical protein
MDTIPEIVFNFNSQKPDFHASNDRRSSNNDGSPDSFTFVRKRKPLTPEKRKELEEVYQRVVVHDYDDEYHLSEEERKRKFMFYEAFQKVIRCKRKYRKLDEFVSVYRLCLNCLDIVAAQNGIYSPEKFKRMVLKGTIEVFGLNFPKYIGKDKKDINWEYISQFIVDYSRDPFELAKDKSSAITDLDDDEVEQLLFDEDELQAIKDIIEHPVEDVVSRPFDEDDLKEDQEDLIIVASQKQTKELVECVPEVIKGVKELVREKRKSNARDQRLNSFVFELTEDDFDQIERIDHARGYVSDSDIPKFQGNILSRKDYKKYLYALENYENEQIKVNYNGKMRTIAEVKEIELKNSLEAAGWNVRNLYHNKEHEKKLKKARKRNLKQEEKLKKRLIEVQERNKKRYGKKSKSKDIEFNTGKKNKKKKKDKESD